MKYVDYMTKLANRFERKLSLAQQSAQSGELQKALSDAGALPGPDAVSPLLNAVGIPDTSAVEIFMVIDHNLNVTFSSVMTPAFTPDPSKTEQQNQQELARLTKLANVPAGKLNKLLFDKYSASMKKALLASKLAPTDTVKFSWLKY